MFNKATKLAAFPKFCPNPHFCYRRQREEKASCVGHSGGAALDAACSSQPAGTGGRCPGPPSSLRKAAVTAEPCRRTAGAVAGQAGAFRKPPERPPESEPAGPHRPPGPARFSLRWRRLPLTPPLPPPRRIPRDSPPAAGSSAKPRESWAPPGPAAPFPALASAALFLSPRARREDGGCLRRAGGRDPRPPPPPLAPAAGRGWGVAGGGGQALLSPGAAGESGAVRPGEARPTGPSLGGPGPPRRLAGRPPRGLRPRSGAGRGGGEGGRSSCLSLPVLLTAALPLSRSPPD